MTDQQSNIPEQPEQDEIQEEEKETMREPSVL